MSIVNVNGGKRLSGSVSVYGAKNAVLPILAASIMTEEPVFLTGCPILSDVSNMMQILRVMGCEATQDGACIHIDAKHAHSHEMPTEISKEIRSSIFMLGPLLSRFRKAWVTYPGGCEIGLRPIDLHLKGLRELNVLIREEDGAIHCNGEQMRGAEITLDYPSVGATENIMMAAVTAEGKTLIHNAAREPEIVDLAKFIQNMGGNISGAGQATICIEGVDSLHGCDYRIMPDRIVAGTLMVAAGVTYGDITLQDVMPEHMRSVIAKMKEAGCMISEGKDWIRIRGPKRPNAITLIETRPYPGFPTDMQAQMFPLATIADGTTVVVENVFENRMKHVAELLRMGADITLKDRTAVIRGVAMLRGTHVEAKDLRGGAALVLAGLAAMGTTKMDGAHYIDRGYQDFIAQLQTLGADIKRV